MRYQLEFKIQHSYSSDKNVILICVSKKKNLWGPTVFMQYSTGSFNNGVHDDFLNEIKLYYVNYTYS